MPALYKIIEIGLLIAFVVLVANKTGTREACKLYFSQFTIKPAVLITEMLECDFCFSFWLSLFVCACLAIYLQDAYWIIVPIFSTPITRMLI